MSTPQAVQHMLRTLEQGEPLPLSQGGEKVICVTPSGIILPSGRFLPCQVVEPQVLIEAGIKVIGTNVDPRRWMNCNGFHCYGGEGSQRQPEGSPEEIEEILQPLRDIPQGTELRERASMAAAAAGESWKRLLRKLPAWHLARHIPMTRAAVDEARQLADSLEEHPDAAEVLRGHAEEAARATERHLSQLRAAAQDPSQLELVACQGVWEELKDVAVELFRQEEHRALGSSGHPLDQEVKEIVEAHLVKEQRRVHEAAKLLLKGQQAPWESRAERGDQLLKSINQAMWKRHGTPEECSARLRTRLEPLAIIATGRNRNTWGSRNTIKELADVLEVFIRRQPLGEETITVRGPNTEGNPVAQAWSGNIRRLLEEHNAQAFSSAREFARAHGKVCRLLEQEENKIEQLISIGRNLGHSLSDMVSEEGLDEELARKLEQEFQKEVIDAFAKGPATTDPVIEEAWKQESRLKQQAFEAIDRQEKVQRREQETEQPIGDLQLYRALGGRG